MPYKPNPYHLFLDDCREPKNVTWIELPPHDWVVVRSYKQFVDTIKEKGVPTTVSFDHDLADEHYLEYTRVHQTTNPSPINYSQFKELTGYDCAKFLVNYCIDNNVELPLYYLHTMNGVGAANIASIMESGRRYLFTFIIPKK